MAIRRIIHLSARSFFLFSALLLPSCLPLDNPLSDPEKAKPDTQLFGAWKAIRGRGEEVPKPEFVSCLIGKSGIRGAPSGVMKMVLSDIDKEHKIGMESWCFFPTVVDGRSYINLVIFRGERPGEHVPTSWDQRKIEGYGLMKFKVEGDRLIIWWGDLKAARAAIEKRQLMGTAKEEGWLKLLDVHVAGGEDLARFLAGGGDKVLFPNSEESEMVFERLK